MGWVNGMPIFLDLMCILIIFGGIITHYSTAADTKKEPYLRSYLNRRYNICPHV